MWENERRNRIILNVIVLVVLVIVGISLYIGLNSSKKQLAAESAALREERNNQMQEISNNRQENLDALQKIYEEDLEVVAQYLPGIVCWGDSLTAGSSGNVSYPRTLQKYIDTYLCDVYDLRYSVTNADGVSRVNWEDYTISIPVVNMGAGQESAATVLGRAGVVPYTVNKEFVIPAETETVAIEITAPGGKKVEPLTAGSVGVNPVTIAGVEGTLSKSTSGDRREKSPYRFTRLEPGEEVSVDKGAEIIPACTDQYKNYLHIVWLGTYGDFGSADKLVKDIQLLLNRQSINPDRFLVIGPCTTKGSWATPVSSLDSVDSAMLQAFGDHYINLRKYLIEDGLRDANLTSSGFTAKGTIPNAFRSNAGGADMNAVAYQLVGKLVYERMDMLGYFDEIRKELKLDVTTQALLEKDPNFFANQLNTK